MKADEITGAEIASAIDMSSHMFWALRTPLRHLDGIGRMHGAGYLYSAAEADQIAIAIVISRGGTGYKLGFQEAAAKKDLIVSAASLLASPDEPDITLMIPRLVRLGKHNSICHVHINLSETLRSFRLRLADARAGRLRRTISAGGRVEQRVSA